MNDELTRGFREAREDIEAWARGDKSRVREYTMLVPDDVDVKALRGKMGLTQADFAILYGFKLSAVQAWERKKNRRRPDRAARILLKVIEHEPEAVRRALGEKI